MVDFIAEYYSRNYLSSVLCRTVSATDLKLHQKLDQIKSVKNSTVKSKVFLFSASLSLLTKCSKKNTLHQILNKLRLLV